MNETCACIMGNESSMDMDDEFDIRIAECLMKERLNA